MMILFVPIVYLWLKFVINIIEFAPIIIHPSHKEAVLNASQNLWSFNLKCIGTSIIVNSCFNMRLKVSSNIGGIFCKEKKWELDFFMDTMLRILISLRESEQLLNLSTNPRKNAILMNFRFFRIRWKNIIHPQSPRHSG